MPDSSNVPQVILTPLKPALIAGVAQRLPVLVRVHAPDADPAQIKPRKPYSLALVIDRSGSMSGAPLREAVRCAAHIVGRLAPGDTASLVVFDDRVRTLVAAQPVGDGKVFRGALAQVHEGGSTNLHGGWEVGAKSLQPGAAEAAIARVILLSDGNANVGEVDPATIAAQCGAMAASGVTTSTYGLGRQFNEDLMVAMAKEGQGNHYYGDSASDLMEPFAEEFDLISSLYVRHVKLSLGAPDGVRIRLLNDYPVEDREGFPLVRLPDIPWGSEAWAIVELEIDAGRAAEDGLQVLQAGVSGTTPEGEPVVFPEVVLHVRGMSPGAWDALLPDPLVAERLAEVETARILQQARDAADAGDWAAIQALLATARERYAKYPWALEVIESLAELANPENILRFKKEALYSSRKMSTRLSDKEALSALLQEDAKASYLRRKKRQGKAQFDLPDDSAPSA
ncbi:MAG: hypothetical protein MOGDAGHF_00718 [Rhodocyclaceae bacterium]|nr:hypothetical protein [Rhodocyclaceae bacterium]